MVTPSMVTPVTSALQSFAWRWYWAPTEEVSALA